MLCDLLKEALIFVEECADHSVTANDLSKEIRKKLREAAKAPTKEQTTIQQQAEQNVLAVRGSYDAPGFDACVEAEKKRLETEQPVVLPVNELVDDLAHDAEFRDAVFKTDEAYFHLLAHIAVLKLRPYLRKPEREISFVDALASAREVVKAYPLYRKFIDGTPLQNDIAVWMAEFAVNGGKP